MEKDFDDERLTRMVGIVFDRLPDPDAARLRKVGERLAYQARRAPRARPLRRRYVWWIGVLLVGSAAAWWAEEHFFGGTDEAGQRTTETLSAPAIEEFGKSEREQPQKPATPSATGRADRSPTIYRRESTQ